MPGLERSVSGDHAVFKAESVNEGCAVSIMGGKCAAVQVWEWEPVKEFVSAMARA